MSEYIDRIRGALVGLAVGDALGTTLEFRSPGTFEPIDDMVGGGPFGLEAGQWTDDTSMALCLAESLIECQGFNPTDQMQRYVRWLKEGYNSATGHCFDIGGTVHSALISFQTNGEPFAGSTDRYAAGNGSLMRLAPVPMLYHRCPVLAVQYAAQSSRTTHGPDEAIDACRYFAWLIMHAINGASKETLLTALDKKVWNDQPLAPAITAIAAGSYKEKSPPEIRGTGHVVAALEAALWAFYHGNDFSEGALLAVNLGDDADTTGAIYGQLAGAYHGMSGIPTGWLGKLYDRDRIIQIADQLFALAGSVKCGETGTENL